MGRTNREHRSCSRHLSSQVFCDKPGCPHMLCPPVGPRLPFTLHACSTSELCCPCKQSWAIARALDSSKTRTSWHPALPTWSRPLTGCVQACSNEASSARSAATRSELSLLAASCSSRGLPSSSLRILTVHQPRVALLGWRPAGVWTSSAPWSLTLLSCHQEHRLHIWLGPSAIHPLLQAHG